MKRGAVLAAALAAAPLCACRDVAEAWAMIGGFIETVCNAQRLRSALAHQSPQEYEESASWAAAQ
jgi:hypothetical protein